MSERKALIRLFVAKDPRSERLLEEIKDIIGRIPENRRPEVKIHVVKVDDPREFPKFLTYLEEIYGGLYTVEFRKYGVEKLPTIVINGKKVLEGRFPSREELIGILRSEGIEVPERPRRKIPAPVVRPPQPYYMPPAEMREQITPSQPPTPPPELPPPSPAEHLPSEPESPVQTTQEGEASLETAPPQPQPPTVSPAQPMEREQNLRGTCYDCIFFDESRSWCLLLRTSVNDPLRPICGRRK